MKTYWDLSEPERAKLTYEQVSRYADAELMTKGVLMPQPPKITHEEAPVVTPRAFYTLSAPCRYGSDKAIDVVFETRDAAEANLRHAFDVEHDYEIDAFVARRTRPTIREVLAITEEDATAHRSALEARKAAKGANDKERERFAAESKRAQQALAGMWEDWNECVLRDRELRRIAETFEVYTTTAEGDRTVALKFLQKTFTGAEIEAAGQWCDVPELARVNAPVALEAH